MIQNRSSTGVSVIVPTLNESDNIVDLLHAISGAFGSPSLVEILVVDDSSEDGTADLAEAAEMALAGSLTVIRREGKRSLSESVIDGARSARHDVVAVIDADFSHDPRNLPELSEPVLRGEADVCIGSRHVDSGVISDWPFRRKALSRIGTWIARRATPVRDPLSGFFATRRQFLLREDLLRPRGYKILLEILGRFQGLRVLEFPIHFRDRTAGSSKFGMRQALQFVTQVIALRVGPRDLHTSVHVDSEPRVSQRTSKNETHVVGGNLR